MGEYVSVGDAPAEGEIAGFFVDGVQIAVANVGGTLYAFDDVCTHMQCLVSQGDLEEKVVTCPCHGGQYDVTSGEVLAGPPPAPLKTYPARIEGGSVQVQV